jgi:hypothetical protein
LKNTTLFTRLHFRVIALAAGLAIACCTTVQAQTSVPPADSLYIAAGPGYDSVSSLHRFLLGKTYRKEWATPVRIRVVQLATEHGGMTVLKKGGGMQTKSLRLKDAQGREWALRSIQKYPERALPPTLRKTIFKTIMQDQISTSLPFSALTVPPLAEALGVPHANPEIVYIGDDAGLGKYRKEYSNQVYLLEERQPEDVEKTDNTDKVREKLQEDNDVEIDERTVVRARLLDFVLGDWDRHNDQWRWIKVKDGKTRTYVPVPRDRDQVYYKTQGILPFIVSHQYLGDKFQPYSDHIRNVTAWNFNARYFDRLFMVQLNEEDWRQAATFVKAQLTDSLVEAALRRMPDTIYAMTGATIKKDLLTRRDNLEKYALEHYRFLSRAVDIPLSDKHEEIQVQYLPDQQVEVTIYKIKKDGERDRQIYHRVFVPGITKEIRVYGLGGKDIFSVTGETASPIKVRMIGGDGKDSFSVAAHSPNRNRLYLYDRKDQDNQIPDGIKARKCLGTDSSVNAFDPHNFVYDRFGPVFYADFTRDDKVRLMAGLLKITHGFRKTPYASKQQLLATYATAREALRIDYDGDFKQVFGKTGLLVSADMRGPNYYTNFFGVGNNTEFIDRGNREINYYRARLDYFTADVRLDRPVSRYLSVNAGLRGQVYTSSVSRNENKFILSYNQSHPLGDVFNTKYYGGLAAGARFDSRNNQLMPYKGIHAHVNITNMYQFNGAKDRFTLFYADVATYGSILDSSIVLATRIGGGTSLGDPAFWQMLRMGGGDYLRGFRNHRFAGKTMLYHNIEARIKICDFVSYLLPGTLGVVLFNDVGRVWQPGENSSRWHDGYGGGLYLIPAQLILLQVFAGHSSEGTMPYVSLGFRF